MKNKYKTSVEIRDFLCSLVFPRFESLRKNKVFCVSTYTILRDVFGFIPSKKVHYELYHVIYLMLRGEPFPYISSKLKIDNQKLRSDLSNLYKELDVEGKEDMLAKIFLWFVQREGILIIPSERMINKQMTKEEIDEAII